MVGLARGTVQLVPYSPDWVSEFEDEKAHLQQIFGERRTHYLHIMELGSARWRDGLVFRDYLRTHLDKRDEYQRLKESLATKFADNRTEYTATKSSFITACLADARR